MKTLVVLMMLIGLAVAPAMGEVVPENHAGEPGLYEIANSLYGTAYTSCAEMEFARIPNTGVFSGPMLVHPIGRNAGSSQTLGYYQPAGSGQPTKTQLFTDSGQGAIPDQTISPKGIYGLCDGVEILGVGPATWFSEISKNIDNKDHMVIYDVYQLTGNAAYSGVMLVGFEDGMSLGDEDYNDLVVQLTQPPPTR